VKISRIHRQLKFPDHSRGNGILELQPAALGDRFGLLKLLGADPAGRMAQLAAEREPLYARLADAISRPRR